MAQRFFYQAPAREIFFGLMAQLVARLVCNEKAVGPNPTESTSSLKSEENENPAYAG